MLQKNELTERLILLDSSYFTKGNSNKVKSEDLSSVLATYLYDSDISGLDEEYWDILCKIRNLFGDFIVWEVIKCLCFGEHDT